MAVLPFPDSHVFWGDARAEGDSLGEGQGFLADMEFLAQHLGEGVSDLELAEGVGMKSVVA